jgi:two-component system sensor histidine kinase KdpD
MSIRDRLVVDLRLVPRYLIALASVAAATAAVALLGPLHLATASLLYLATVLVIAVVAGRGPAIAASIASFLTFDFFFTDPRFTFTVRDPSEWVALLTFLLVAIVTGQLAAGQRSRVEEAEAREREARLVHDVSDLLAGRPFKEALEAVAERLRSELGLQAVAIDLATDASNAVRVGAGDPTAIRQARQSAGQSSVLGAGAGASSSQPAEPGRWVRIAPPHGEKMVPRATGMIRVPIRAGSTTRGDLILLGGREHRELGPREARLLATAAGQLALAVDQERLRRETTEAEVLRRTDELKTALLDAVSHDLRTPLASIIASAGSLRQADVNWTDPERREFAEAIEQEAERLNRIVGNLLDLSRIQGGTLVPTMDWHDPSLVLTDAVERLRPALAGHRLELDVPANLPPVLLDPVEIDQVVANLVENAAKYTAPDSTIRVAASVDGDELTVSVEDTGPGIPPSSLPRLFEPFYRAPQTGRVRGSGLGLAVARGLVAAHGGRIWAENRAEGGARFAFALPAPPVEVEAAR